VFHLVAKARAAKAMNFFPGGVHQLTFDNGTPILTVAIIAHNTSNQQMTVKSFDANVTANGQYIGNASSFAPQTILQNSQTTLLVNIRLSLLNIVNDLIKAIQYGNFAQTVRLTGNANVDNVQVPIDMNFTAG
jgi:LEA14-like dessication related protein